MKSKVNTHIKVIGNTIALQSMGYHFPIVTSLSSWKNNNVFGYDKVEGQMDLGNSRLHGRRRNMFGIYQKKMEKETRDGYRDAFLIVNKVGLVESVSILNLYKFGAKVLKS